MAENPPSLANSNFLVLIALSWILVAPTFLNALGRYLVVKATPAPADAMVVLSGPIPDRALAAADLYHQGLSLLVFLTRGYRSPSFRYTGEGVPPSD